MTARRLAVKVPEITVVFWVLKLLTTGMGEAMSDYAGSVSTTFGAVVITGGFALAMWLQLRRDAYYAPCYWFAVMMVAVFGTMAADGIHADAGIPYAISTPAFALVTAGVFALWHRSEGTLSIHSIDTRRRELFYWAAVLGTFALGTAAGDLTASSLSLGFLHSVFLFGGIILIPAIGWWRLGMNAIAAFWFAYVLTRPLGASFADWFSKSHALTGLGLGDGTVSLIAFLIFVPAVAWVARTKIDVQSARARPQPHQVPVLAPEAE